MNCTCYVVTSSSISCALWKPDLLDNELTNSSYSFVWLDRNRHGGGILLYIRDDVTLMILATWNYHCTMVVATAFVSVPCSVQLHHSPCFSTVVYCMQNFALIGDFNVNVLDISSTLYQFMVICCRDMPFQNVLSSKGTILI